MIMENTLRHCKHVTERTLRKVRKRTEGRKEMHCPGYIHMQAQSGLCYQCVKLLSSFAGVKVLQVQNIVTGIEVVH